MKIIRTEPARVIAAVVALLALAGAFGLAITDQQSAAIVASVSALLALASGEVTRSQVSPVASVAQQLAAAQVAPHPMSLDRPLSAGPARGATCSDD